MGPSGQVVSSCRGGFPGRPQAEPEEQGRQTRAVEPGLRRAFVRCPVSGLLLALRVDAFDALGILRVSGCLSLVASPARVFWMLGTEGDASVPDGDVHARVGVLERAPAGMADKTAGHEIWQHEGASQGGRSRTQRQQQRPRARALEGRAQGRERGRSDAVQILHVRVRGARL